MCFIDHSFAHNFFLFHFVAKPMLEFRENVMFFQIAQKFQQLQFSLGEKSTFFAAPEVAWCLSIVGQAAKATYIGVYLFLTDVNVWKRSLSLSPA